MNRDGDPGLVPQDSELDRLKDFEQYVLRNGVDIRCREPQEDGSWCYTLASRTRNLFMAIIISSHDLSNSYLLAAKVKYEFDMKIKSL